MITQMKSIRELLIDSPICLLSQETKKKVFHAGITYGMVLGPIEGSDAKCPLESSVVAV
jgi:hypothetical protein